MRFIIHEMGYEKPLTAGQWQYVRDGQATGAIEEWRLTKALDGYHFLRVDLDARAAASGRSTIYHLTLDENGAAAQLKFRFWDAGMEVVGTVVLEEDALIVTRERDGRRQEDVVNTGSGYAFWFPATAGLGLLARLGDVDGITGITLRSTADDPAMLMGPQLTKLSVREAPARKVEMLGKSETLKGKIITWADQQRTIWVNEQGWPLLMERDDGLTAVMKRLVKYQRNDG